MVDRLAVIFDVDGVLVDSYTAHFRSWQLLWAEHDRAMTEQQFVETFGRTTRESICYIFPDHDYTEQQITALDDRKEELFREIIQADFPDISGAKELVDTLIDQGFAVAVGSSGPPENVKLVTDHLGVTDRLGATITATHVTRGKPDPQVFLLAAEQLTVPPRNCLVVEDAPAGIAAAQAAGMASIGFASTGRTLEELATADLTVKSLAELSPALIRKLIAAQRQS
jgi:beta-phosphoglucomutase